MKNATAAVLGSALDAAVAEYVELQAKIDDLAARQAAIKETFVEVLDTSETYLNPFGFGFRKVKGTGEFDAAKLKAAGIYEASLIPKVDAKAATVAAERAGLDPEDLRKPKADYISFVK